MSHNNNNNDDDNNNNNNNNNNNISLLFSTDHFYFNMLAVFHLQGTANVFLVFVITQ